mmetsp:Transcript_10227/g.14238  ORF Transcript_10227/g.14238 Transcript_10227/m.14238 type:complete len:80 (-) Transcript_10227:211-450(-)
MNCCYYYCCGYCYSYCRALFLLTSFLLVSLISLLSLSLPPSLLFLQNLTPTITPMVASIRMHIKTQNTVLYSNGMQSMQ